MRFDVRRKPRRRTNLFEKFGAKFELGQFYPSYESNLNAIVAESIVWSIKWSLVGDASCVAICYWCEGDRKNARKYARECVRHGLEYFFGDWRSEVPTDLKTQDASWWRLHAMWMRPLSEALCWATLLGDWKAVQRMATYPLRDTKRDVCTTPEQAAAYYALACFLRGDPPKAYENSFEIIAKRKGEKPKLLAAVIRALQRKNQREFQKHLCAYLQFFRMREFRRTCLSKLLSLDGTTLVNIGKRYGFEPKVPPECEDHIIRFG